MAVLKNILLQGLLAVTAVAMPLASEEPSLDVRNEDAINSVLTPTLEARKNTNKCEAHIHIDSSNGLCGNKCTQKFNIDIVDKVEIATSKNKNLIFDGALPTGIISNDDKWRSNFNLAYDTQKWSSHECANYKYKSPRVSNGHRHEYDLWCEFDC
ncbi:uncharacterized protein PG998_006163 [Apiospora kogelbergensis]|uniref:uncharacterized protein n=1 Tax=Apiospora kogelbergensis TaxID=1337665 RepID=UPI00312CF4AC